MVMNTNGTLLSDKMIDRIVDSRLDIIRFSIDGSAETFKRVRGVDLFKIEELEPRLELAEWSGESEQNGTCNGNDNSANGSCGTTNDSCGAAPKK